MRKIGLVIAKEYQMRVRKRSFLIVTILVPILTPAIIGLFVYLIKQERSETEQQLVYVVDRSGILKLDDTPSQKYLYLDVELEAAKTVFLEGDGLALAHLPKFSLDDPKGFSIYFKGNPGLSEVESFTQQLQQAIRRLNIAA